MYLITYVYAIILSANIMIIYLLARLSLVYNVEAVYIVHCMLNQISYKLYILYVVQLLMRASCILVASVIVSCTVSFL